MLTIKTCLIIIKHVGDQIDSKYINKELLYVSVKFDLDLPCNVLQEVLQVNIVDLGQENKSGSDLLLSEVI